MGLQDFRLRFVSRPADALPSSEPESGRGNLAPHTVAQDSLVLS